MRLNQTLRASAALAALAVALPLTASPSFAQETQGTQASQGIEVVTVTARKRHEELRNVPIDVSVVSADTIAEQHMDQVKDIAAIVPGLNINSDSVGRTFIDIRGVGTTLLDGVQPGVGVFIDSIYMPVTSYLNMPMVDVERVEVLKGPQGTLFGNNTLGGAINIITRQPGDQLEGKLSADYAGPDDYQSYSGSVSGPLITGKLQGRIALAYQRDDGFIKNVLAGGHYNPLEQQALNTTLRWEPAADANVTLNAYYDRVHGGLDNYYNVTGPTDYTDKAATNVPNLGNYTYSGVNVKGVFDIASLATTVTAVGAYDHRSNNFGSDSDFGPFDFLRGHGSGTLHTGTGELRFDTKWSGSISTLIGLFYDDQVMNEHNVTTLVPFALSIPSIAEQDTTNYAVYGTVFWDIDSTTEFTAGLRWDHQKQTAINGAVGAITSNELEPRFTLDKHWTPDLMTYASIARGFRGGGINPPFSPNPTYRGDSVWTYETGLKANLLDNRLALDAAVFYNDYYHFIGQNSLAPATPPGVGFVGINLNSGHVESPGAELEATWKPTNAWTLSGGITYVHARITDGSEYQKTTGMALPSNRIIFLPDWNYNLSSDYLWSIDNDNALDFNVGVVFKGERKGSSLAPGFAPTLSSYTLVNGSITWRRDNWDLAVYSTNLFDEKYFESYIDVSVLAAAGLAPPVGSDLGIMGDGRRVGVSATYRF